MGIYDVEYRNPSINIEELENYRRLKAKFPQINFHVHIYLNRRNIDWAINETSVEYISTFIKFPITKTTESDLRHLFDNSTKKIRVGIENIAVVSPLMLEQIIGLLRGEKLLDRIAFSDTLGNFTQEKVHTLLEQIEALDLKNKNLEFHLHNDYGFAAATASQLLLETKNTNNDVYFSTSMFGLGERNGILSYGDLFSNLIRLGIPHNLKLEVYGELLTLMKGSKICFNRDPLCLDSFSHFASSHILSEVEGNKYNNISPENFGLTSKFIFNNLTDSEVFNQINNKLLKLPEIDNISVLKKYVLEKMEEKNETFLELEEVIRIIREYNSNNVS
jgi:isopropylmalate/homocitrate/citramalate synthase